MKKQPFISLLILLLALLGVAALFTGLLKDEKSFYVLGAVCMSIFSIFLFLNSRSNVRPRQ